MLDDAQMETLGARARAGDIDARNEIAAANLGLARQVANRWRRLFPQEIEDITQEVSVGLLTAATTFDPTRGKFSTHGTWRCRGRLQEAVRPLQKRNLFEKRMGDLDHNENFPNLEAEIIDEADGPVQQVERAEGMATLQAAIGELPERNQFVLRARFWRGLTLLQAAAEMNVSKERVRQLEHQSLRRLRDVLEGRPWRRDSSNRGNGPGGGEAADRERLPRPKSPARARRPRQRTEIGRIAVMPARPARR